MSSFTTQLEYEPTNKFRHGRPEYRILKPFVYEVGDLNSGLKVTVPEEFVTDLASIPLSFVWLFAPDGPYAKAAVVHDFLYVKGLVSRRMCDLIFYEGMTVLDVDVVTRRVLYYAVRIGGFMPYNRYRFGQVQSKINKRVDNPPMIYPKA